MSALTARVVASTTSSTGTNAPSSASRWLRSTVKRSFGEWDVSFNELRTDGTFEPTLSFELDGSHA
jgi:hypothetical protein